MRAHRERGEKKSLYPSRNRKGVPVLSKLIQYSTAINERGSKRQFEIGKENTKREFPIKTVPL